MGNLDFALILWSALNDSCEIENDVMLLCKMSRRLKCCSMGLTANGSCIVAPAATSISRVMTSYCRRTMLLVVNVTAEIEMGEWLEQLESESALNSRDVGETDEPI
mgnify:CR=1 FL=1